MKKNFMKVACAAMAVVIASASFCPAAEAGRFKPSKVTKEKKVLCAENTESTEAVENIYNMLSVMLADSNYKTVVVGDYVSAYNVDCDDTFFLYPVICDGEVAYVAHADAEGEVVVTNNTEAYDAIKALKNGADYLVYVDNGTYFASSKNATVELYSEEIQMLDEGASFDGMSYKDKLDVVSEGEVTTFKKVAPLATLDTQSFTTVDGTEVSTQGWWDWFWGNGGGSSSNTGKTVTKKCAITDFLLQGNYGLCWACSVGTIVNFKTSYKVTGKNVADKMGIGYDDGATAPQIVTALGKYGLSYKQGNKLSWSQVQSNINADKPFVLCMYASNAGHAITGYGYAYNSANNSASASTSLVYAWDSNGYQISFAQNASTINTSGYKFQWYYTVY